MAEPIEHLAKLALINLFFALAEIRAPNVDPHQKLSQAQSSIELAIAQLGRIAPEVFGHNPCDLDTPDAA